MANRRVLLKRKKAAGNIRKITRTMQLIATAKYQAAYARTVATQPYTRKLTELTAQITRAAGNLEHPLMRTPETDDRSALLVVTSNRGLCGGYNSNVMRVAAEYLQEARDAGRETSIHMVGLKGISYCKFRGFALDSEITDIGDSPTYEQIEPLAEAAMNAFIGGEVSSAHVAYMKFVSAGKQVPVVSRFLPLSAEVEGGEAAPETEEAALDYEFSPSPEELLEELLPATVKTRVYQAFMDAAVSEQVARMVAMKGATDAAEDTIKRLTQQYNRARQTQITMELLDIVGGANALA